MRRAPSRPPGRLPGAPAGGLGTRMAGLEGLRWPHEGPEIFRPAPARDLAGAVLRPDFRRRPARRRRDPERNARRPHRAAAVPALRAGVPAAVVDLGGPHDLRQSLRHRQPPAPAVDPADHVPADRDLGADLGRRPGPLRLRAGRGLLLRGAADHRRDVLRLQAQAPRPGWLRDDGGHRVRRRRGDQPFLDPAGAAVELPGLLCRDRVRHGRPGAAEPAAACRAGAHAAPGRAGRPADHHHAGRIGDQHLRGTGGHRLEPVQRHCRRQRIRHGVGHLVDLLRQLPPAGTAQDSRPGTRSSTRTSSCSSAWRSWPR